jgi:hypothetical protein
MIASIADPNRISKARSSILSDYRDTKLPISIVGRWCGAVSPQKEGYRRFF